MILILCSAVGPRNIWFNKDDQWFWCRCLEGHTVRCSNSMLFHFKDGNWVQWSEMTCPEMKTWDLCSTVLFWSSVYSGPWVDVINQPWHQLSSQRSTLGSHLYPRLALDWDLVAPPGLSQDRSAHGWWNGTKLKCSGLCVWQYNLFQWPFPYKFHFHPHIN